MIDFSNAPKQKTESTQLTTPDNLNPEDSLRSAMMSHNLSPDTVIWDGEIHRFSDGGKGKKDCWYVAHSGNISAAVFGDWSSGLWQKWCSHNLATMPYLERVEYEKTKKVLNKKAKKEKLRRQKETKKEAQSLWDKSKEVFDQNHAHLEHKNVISHSLRKDEKTGNLLVPMYDKFGELWNIERIPVKAGAKKKGLKGGKRDGLCFMIHGNSETYLCEGYSTGASIHNATGSTVIIAFNAGNMPKVARFLKMQYTGTQITVCADDDKWKPDKGNAGITKANEAAKILGCEIAVPKFKDETSKPTDFNDLLALEGSEAVKNQLLETVKKIAFPVLTANATKISGKLLKRPKPIEYILNAYDKGMLPKGVVGVVAATGGTGKTFFLLSLAVVMSGGDNMGPITAPKSLDTLVICGEDDQEELERRLWDICNGVFPEKLHAASVYGNMGPLMELDGNKPVRAAAYNWLEETIKAHPGLDVIILDPKSRFYGLDENNNDHATQWIASLEHLAHEYNITVLFSTHTSEANASKISQSMNRGASAIVDGCRWQSGLVRMDKNDADRFNIKNPRSYISFDIPKSNYTADLLKKMYFRRGEHGSLEYCDPETESIQSEAEYLLVLLESDQIKHTRNDLYNYKNEDETKAIFQEMKKEFAQFNRERFKPAIDYLIKNNMIIVDNEPGKNSSRMVINTK